MNEDMSFEDIKRLHLQQPPIPQSVVDDVKEVDRMLKCGYISKEQAAKYLEGIEADLKKLQGMVSSDKIEEIRAGEATELELPLFDELEQVDFRKLMYGDWIEQEGQHDTNH